MPASKWLQTATPAELASVLFENGEARNAQRSRPLKAGWPGANCSRVMILTDSGVIKALTHHLGGDFDHGKIMRPVVAIFFREKAGAFQVSRPENGTRVTLPPINVEPNRGVMEDQFPSKTTPPSGSMLIGGRVPVCHLVATNPPPPPPLMISPPPPNNSPLWFS